MKQKQAKSKSVTSPVPRKKSFRDVAILAAFFAVPAGLVIWMALRSPPAGNRGAGATAPTVAPTQAVAMPLVSVPPANPGSASPGAVVTPSPTPTAVLPPPPRDPKQLLAILTEVDFSGGPITADRAAGWKQAHQALVKQGAAGVPAIREFLAKNVDVDFDASKGGDLLGFATARLALFDVLRQIPGSESIATSVEVLQATADPREIGTLAKNLEEQEPGKRRQEAAAAAREALSQAGKGLMDAYDVGPLFEVVQLYGGAAVASDLEAVASKYNFYATIALGGLPNGAGIPALARMAQDVSIQNVMSLRILAQLASKFPEAKAVLIKMVQANAMPYSAWAGVQAALGGDVVEYGSPILTARNTPPTAQNVRSYHINYGHQNYRTFTVSQDWPEARVKEQLAVIDQLIAVDANLETLQFLQDARLGLAARLGK